MGSAREGQDESILDGLERDAALVEAEGQVAVLAQGTAQGSRRLARTDKDFCHLLEVCQIFGTLIADDAQIYNLGVTDDVLVLGIKGTLSVVEPKILKALSSKL
jgi:hypothetical protein